jgi:heptosyltransferase-2
VERRFGALDEIERLLELSRPLGDLAPGSDTRLAAREWKRRGAMSPEGEGAPGRGSWPARWPEVWPALDLLPADEEAAAAFRASLPPGPVLGIHPGSAWGSKRWTDEGFAVVARLAADAGANVLLFAGPGEESGVAGILRLAGLAEESPRIRNLAGRLGLIRLAAFLRLLDCFLVNDSGPMHLAWMQRVPVVALFGPTVREHGFFPRGEAARVLEAPVVPDCRPCGLHGRKTCPRGDHACMTGIDPDTVWQAVRQRLFG